MSTRLTRSLLVSGLVLGFALVGCSSEEEASTAPPASTEPAPTEPADPLAGLSEQALWANTLCGATSQLVLTADLIGSDLTYEPTSDLEVFDQYQAQLDLQVADFNTALDGVKDALGEPPIDLDPVATKVITDAVEDAEAAFTETKGHVTALSEETTVKAKTVELASATITFTSAATSALEAADGLAALASSASDSAAEAFEQAPACEVFLQ